MLPWITRTSLVLVTGALLAACTADAGALSKGGKAKGDGDADDSTQPNDDEPGTAEAPPSETIPKAAFRFGACTGNYAEASTCGTAQVPLDYAKPDGKKIELFVAGFGDGKAKTRLFMVQGGPGGSADGILFLAKAIREKRPDVDVMVVEHRGVGRSTRLLCSAAQEPANVTGSEAAACAAELKAKWGDGLQQFTTSNAARDLASAIQSLRPAGTKAFVYGVSYGTYLVHRLLQIAPQTVDGAVLDSVVPPEGQTFDTFDGQADPVLKRLAEVCKRSRSCAASLGADPFASMSRIVTTFDNARCASVMGFDKQTLRGVLFSMLQNAETAALVPSFLVRLSRCNALDQQAARRFFDVLNGQASVAPRQETSEGDLGSGALYNSVVFSELWTNPAPSEATLRARLAPLVLTTGAIPEADGSALPQLLDLEKRRLAWPTYERDRYVGKWAAPTVPVLTMNGDFDVQTPIETARLYETKLAGAGKTFVFVPFANHGTIYQSLTRSGDVCGLRIVLSFLEQPSAPDTSCTKETVAPDVEVSPEVARFVYGTNTAYTTTVSAAPTAGLSGSIFADDADLESPRLRRLKDSLVTVDRLNGGRARRPVLRP